MLGVCGILKQLPAETEGDNRTSFHGRPRRVCSALLKIILSAFLNSSSAPSFCLQKGGILCMGTWVDPGTWSPSIHSVYGHWVCRTGHSGILNHLARSDVTGPTQTHGSTLCPIAHRDLWPEWCSLVRISFSFKMNLTFFYLSGWSF